MRDLNKRDEYRQKVSPVDNDQYRPDMVSILLHWSAVIEFRGWGLVTQNWGPISLNPLGDSYGEPGFRSKRGFCGKRMKLGEGFVEGGIRA